MGVPTSTNFFNCIHTITPTLVKPKAAASTLAAASKVDKGKEDAAKKEGDEKKDEVSVSTTFEEVDEVLEGSYTTITEVEEHQKVINNGKEDVKDNQDNLENMEAEKEKVEEKPKDLK